MIALGYIGFKVERQYPGHAGSVGCGADSDLEGFEGECAAILSRLVQPAADGLARAGEQGIVYRSRERRCRRPQALEPVIQHLALTPERGRLLADNGFVRLAVHEQTHKALFPLD